MIPCWFRFPDQPETAPGRFSTPHGLALDSKGRLYVAHTGNNRIQKFAV